MTYYSRLELCNVGLLDRLDYFLSLTTTLFVNFVLGLYVLCLFSHRLVILDVRLTSSTGNYSITVEITDPSL